MDGWANWQPSKKKLNNDDNISRPVQFNAPIKFNKLNESYTHAQVIFLYKSEKSYVVTLRI